MTTELAAKLREARALCAYECECDVFSSMQVVGMTYMQVWKAREAMERILNPVTKWGVVTRVSRWNDATGRTQAEVLALFDQAIEEVEGET